MNCIIVDDNEMSRASMKLLVSQIPYLNLLGIYSSACEAMVVFDDKKVDLMLLDIEMPDMTGIEFVKNLKDPPLTILATSNKEYALEAFEINIIDYILKPVSLDRFVRAISKAKDAFDNVHKNTGSPKENIFVKVNGVLTNITLNDILWIEALGDYIIINTADKKYTIHSTMKVIESKLDPDKFIRVHRSYIVSVSTINAIDEGTIVINKQLIPVGAVYKENLIKHLNLL